MKSLDQFKTLILEEEKKEDFSKFDMLVRAGLANKAQIMRLHRILEKMTEERPQFNSADRAIMQNLFNRMVDLISNNKQIFQHTRRAVREESLSEGMHNTADFKLSSDGRKIRAHRFKVGDLTYAKDDSSDDDQVDNQKIKSFKESDDVKVNTNGIKNEPPFTLVLKRKAIRMYPNNTRVALYWSERLKRYISVPYEVGGDVGLVQVESVDPNSIKMTLEENAINELETIKKTKQNGKILHSDGKSSSVDYDTADAILKVHNKLNDENKKKIIDLAVKSKDHFNKVLAFAKHHSEKK